jgi:hypothetical protein
MLAKENAECILYPLSGINELKPMLKRKKRGEIDRRYAVAA